MGSFRIRTVLGLVLASALLSACHGALSPQHEEEPSRLILSIQSDKGVSASWMEEIHTVDITGLGPDGESITARNVNRATPVEFSVEPGRWSIEARAHNLEDIMVGHGETETRLQSGKKTVVRLVLSSTIYAYAVTFDSQGAAIPADPVAMTVSYPATTVGTLPVQPVYDGFFFGGWWTEPNGTGTRFYANTVVTADITVYAHWTEIQSFVVTFDSQGAEVPASPATMMVTQPDTVTGSLPSPPELTGYDFGGWWTGTEGSGTQFGASTPVTADITVYAWWIPVSGGDLEIVINLANPSEPVIEFGGQSATLNKDNGDVMTVTATAGFSSYQWYLDGVSTETGNSYIIYSSGMIFGTYNVALVVTDGGGTPYSAGFSFTVVGN
jgi:hypothetical protein